MSKSRRSKTISDTAHADKVLPSSTERTIDYRQRQVSKGEIRWEISISDKVKSAVTEISKFEKLTAGVTAVKLLALGIETYMANTQSSVAVVLTPGQSHACADIAFKLGNIIRSPAIDIDSGQEEPHLECPDEETLTPDRRFQPATSNLGGVVQNTTNGGDAPIEAKKNADIQVERISDIFKGRRIGEFEYKNTQYLKISKDD